MVEPGVDAPGHHTPLVMAGQSAKRVFALDDHLLRKILVKFDGYAGQARV
jgi:hypothetical protein